MSLKKDQEKHEFKCKVCDEITTDILKYHYSCKSCRKRQSLLTETYDWDTWSSGGYPNYKTHQVTGQARRWKA